MNSRPRITNQLVVRGLLFIWLALPLLLPMLHATTLRIFALLLATFFLVRVGRRLRIFCLIFLVPGGLGLRFVPGLPVMRSAPGMVLLVFLPPLLYEGA